MNKLFIVRTPLQLFNAIEALMVFKDHRENHLLLVYGSMSDLDIMLKMLKLMQPAFDNIYKIKFYGLFKQFYAVKLKHILDYNAYDMIFTGMIYHIPLHIANKIELSELFLLDDGNETRLIVRQLESGKYYESDRSKPLLGINQHPDVLKRIKLFTIYENITNKHDCIFNNYSFFKSKAFEIVKKDDRYLIIGSNLVDNYIVGIEQYLEILSLIRSRFKDVELWYAPHRYFSDQYIDAIIKLDIKIYRYETILEIAQLQQGWRFGNFISIRSTAIDTLKMLYDAEASYLRIDKKYFVNESKYQECDLIWLNSEECITL